MFISQSNTYYTASGEQRASKAWYLILAMLDASDGITETYACATCGESHSALYAAARKVALSQTGQFMMGTARILQRSIIVSGTFGNDGLPDHIGRRAYGNISADLLPAFTRLPDAIASSYWHSGADYHSGRDGDYTALRAWALRELLYTVYVKSGHVPYAHWTARVSTGAIIERHAMYRKWQTFGDRARVLRLFAQEVTTPA